MSCFIFSTIYVFLIGPNHGGLQSDAVSTFEVFYVVFVELDGLKVP